MKVKAVFLLLLAIAISVTHLFAQSPVKIQSDTSILASQLVPAKFYTTVSAKADKYYKQVNDRTDKTLQGLIKWENRIKKILEKTSPSTAQQLFGPGTITFSTLLEKYKQGKLAVDDAKSSYDEYRDKVTTTLKYLATGKEKLDSTKELLLSKSQHKINELNVQLKKSEVLQQFIKERKNQLQQQALQFVSNSRYFKKISKDQYYYAQALLNYKETFSDPKKTEALALKLLQKIPAFNSFIKKNSMLASLFRTPGDPADPAYLASLAGLQTNAQVNNLIQQQIAAGGPNAMQDFRQNLISSQTQLNQLKNKILKGGGSNSDAVMPEGFKPNDQKTKSLKQRLEYGTNVQTQSSTAFFPVTTDLSLLLGYKLNGRSIIGIGASYKLGLGRGWNNIQLSQQGAGLRSFIDWKLKGSLWISGGYEMNYKNDFNSIEQLKEYSAWQVSGLVGVSKSIPVKTKFFKKTKMQLLWDFMSYQQFPRTQPVIFRMGYNF